MKLTFPSLLLVLALVLGCPSLWGALEGECPWDALKAGTPPTSANLSAPNYEMGRDGVMLANEPLRPTEIKLLEKAGLTLYPDKNRVDKENPTAQFEDWAQDLDRFLLDNRNNPALKDLVTTFVVDYVNHPAGEALPGDALWTQPRHVDNYFEAYRLPREHDMHGNVLLLKDTNSPAHQASVKISGEELAKAPTMMEQVLGNLKNGLGFVDIIRDGTYKDDRALAKTASLRRQYLSLRLLMLGEFYALQKSLRQQF